MTLLNYFRLPATVNCTGTKQYRNEKGDKQTIGLRKGFEGQSRENSYANVSCVDME